LQRESLKDISRQTILYKKEKSSEDVDAAGHNKIQNIKKDENNFTEENKTNFNDNKKSAKIIENLETKIEKVNKNEITNIQVNINNKIYNNINIINDREDKIYVKNEDYSKSNKIEKDKTGILDEKNTSALNQVSTSNSKSRDDEQYKKELKKRIENLKTHLTKLPDYSNTPNAEEKENERINLGNNEKL